MDCLTQSHPQRVEFSNHCMFARVMSDESICKGVIEAILGIDVARIEYLNAEQVIEPTINSRGIRMDVYLRGSDAVYDIEMQCRNEPVLGRRLRYYQSSIDGSVLGKSDEYDTLCDSYIIFLCTNDPLGYGVPVYSFERSCLEVPECDIDCGAHWVVLNADAWQDEKQESLRDLLNYVKTGEIGGSELAKEIDSAVDEANGDPRWMDNYWSVSTVEENICRRARILERQSLKKGLEEGRAKGLEEGLAKGMEEGRAAGAREAEQRLGLLFEHLLAEGRQDDALRAGSDPGYAAQLYAEYGI